jgi:CheY-like chemotaxis protein
MNKVIKAISAFMKGILPMSKKRILVIDDDFNVRSVICDSLADCGYEVEQASNGELGLDMMKKRMPDLLITDIIMPYRDGIEVILEVRQKYPGLKVLAISGGGRVKTGDYLGIAQRLGSDEILRKPFDMKDLEKAVERLTA